MPYMLDSFGTFYSLNKVNNGNPIVFVHGVGLNNTIWKLQTDFFKEYNTLTYDLLGHGKTPLKKAKVTFNFHPARVPSLHRPWPRLPRDRHPRRWPAPASPLPRAADSFDKGNRPHCR